MSEPAPRLEAIAEVLERARRAAIDYYRLTGRPLGIAGEIGEYHAAALLGLTLADARAPGFDAIDGGGRRYQVKSRSLSELAHRRNQMLGSIKLEHPWDAVLFVLMDETLQPLEIWEASREAVTAALTAPGSKARNERGAMAVSKFRQIGERVWSKDRSASL